MACILAISTIAPTAHAQMISDKQITDQKKLVLTQIVYTLEEQVKLLQMLVIRKLEARVAELKAQQ